MDLSRRKLLKLTGAAAIGSLLPRRAFSANLYNPFEINNGLYAWDLHDEGTEKVFDNLQQMSAINSLYLIGVMHPERRPKTSETYPHNPVRQFWIAEDARCYWHPDPKHYGRIKPRLSDFDWLNQTDWARVFVDAARKRGIKVGIEQSHALVDKERAEKEFADCCQRNMNGEITHVRDWLRPLCPNHPDVQEYVTNLFSELIRSYDVDMVQSCIVHYDDAGPDRSGCFCDHCKKAAKEMGIDLDAAQKALLTDVRAQPALGDWQKFRFEATARFYQKLHAALRTLKPTIDLRYNIHMSTRNPEAWGIDLTMMSKQLDSLRVMDYAEQDGNPAMLETKRAYLTRIRKAVGEKFPIVSAVAVRPKATPDLIKQGIQVCVDTGMDGITLGFYDGADFPNLRAVREGLVAAKVSVT